MNSNSSGFYNFDPLYYLISEKATQTSDIDLNSSLTSPVPIIFDHCVPSSPPKTYEFTKVIRDPNNKDSITVIKDTFTEEVIDSSSSSHQSLSSRYKYCREVIAPIIKAEDSYSSNHCPKPQENDSYKDVSEAEDLSDYQPCEEFFPDTNNTEDNVGGAKMDSNPCKPKSFSGNYESHGNKCMTITNEDKCSKNESPCPPCKSSKTECNKNESYNQSRNNCHKDAERPDCDKKSERPNCDEKADCNRKADYDKKFERTNCKESEKDNLRKGCQKPEPIDECKLKDCIQKCVKEGTNIKKKERNSCSEKVIGVRPPQCPEEKPAYFVYEKQKDQKSPSSCVQPTSPNTSSGHSLLESTSAALFTIKDAVQNFFGVAYQKTKDVIDVVKSESCKYIGSDQKLEPAEKESKTSLNKSDSFLDSASATLYTVKDSVQSFAGVAYKKTKDAVSVLRTESCKNLGCCKNSDPNSEKNSKTNVNKKEAKKPVSCAFSLVDPVERNNDSINLNIEQIVLLPALNIFQNVASKIESTISLASEFNMSRVFEDLIESKMDKSSPFDVATTTPTMVSCEAEPHHSSNFFEYIKSTFYSLFQDPINSDSEEDANADDVFDKFCE